MHPFSSPHNEDQPASKLGIAMYFWLTSAPADLESDQTIKRDPINRSLLPYKLLRAPCNGHFPNYKADFLCAALQMPERYSQIRPREQRDHLRRILAPTLTFT